jgi:3-methyladenine DNA glycosylase AlkD
MYEQITQALDQCANPIKATNKQKSFQTHVGGYGEGDTFIGLTVPQTRSIAKQFQSADTTTLTTLTTLLNSPIHEYRECALYMMADYQYPKSNDQKKQLLFELYTNNLEAVNNWDLVDASAHKIIGRHLLQRNRSPLYKLAQTDHLWKQRMILMKRLLLQKS